MKSNLRKTLGSTLAIFLLVFSLFGYADTSDDGSGYEEPETTATPVAEEEEDEEDSTSGAEDVMEGM